MSIRWIIINLIIYGLAGCSNNNSSSEDNPVTIATGQFKDAGTAGLSYVSGSQSGITGADGSFSYEEGNTVRFFIGGVDLGTAEGKSIVTPTDLVTDGDSNSTKVQNIVRFLMMLDEDNEPSNGITISTSVQTMANNWQPVNFDTLDLANELTVITSDLASINSLNTLPDSNAAKTHLEETLMCMYAGAYAGSFSGDDYGNFGFMVSVGDFTIDGTDPIDGPILIFNENLNPGLVKGSAFSISSQAYMQLKGSIPIQPTSNNDTPISFLSGDDAFLSNNSGASFNGQFPSTSEVSGTWQNGLKEGDFSGVRIGGEETAIYRFTGQYWSDSQSELGLFTFDVSGDNTVSGIAYKTSTGELLTLSGGISTPGKQYKISNGGIIVVGESETGISHRLWVTASDGTAISGYLNVNNGILQGVWSNTGLQNNLSGEFIGNGCKLN